MFAFKGNYTGCLFKDGTEIVIHPDLDQFQYFYKQFAKVMPFKFSDAQFPSSIEQKVKRARQVKEKLVLARKKKQEKLKQFTKRYKRYRDQEKKAVTELKQVQKFPHLIDFLFERKCSVLRLNDLKYQVIFPDRTDIFILGN